MAARIADIARSLEAWAPPGMAESWDRVGLHVGDPTREVTTGLIGLDMTPSLLEEAKSLGAEMILTHHPLLLKPVSFLTPTSPTGYLALRLAEAGIALYCMHTNIDSAEGGVSFALAEKLGLEKTRFLSGLTDQLLKLAVFVPESHADAVQTAMADAGAGRIGKYEACSFTTTGHGKFRAMKGSDPHIGTEDGNLETVDELRIEVEVTRWKLSSVVKAMTAAHPYDEVAYDLFRLEKTYTGAGLGVIGELPKSESLENFLNRVSESVDNPALRFSGELESTVQRVAVCGGAGTPYIRFALQEQADAFVTSDLSHHRFFEAMDHDGVPKMAIIDAGHYETERFTENILKAHLTESFPGVAWHITSQRTGAGRTFVRPE